MVVVQRRVDPVRSRSTVGEMTPSYVRHRRGVVVVVAGMLTSIATGCSDDAPTDAAATGSSSTGAPDTTAPVTGPVVASTAPPTTAPINAMLQAELLEMLDRDQAARTDSALEGDAAGEDMGRVDAEHARRMEEILDEYGWPGWSLVGREGAFAAWVLIQHADLHPDLQRRGLEMMQAAVDAGDADPSDLAYLIDRVRVADGEPQLYGTQWNIDEDGELTPRTPIEDEHEVDARRAAVGLGTLEEYKEELRSMWG
jgi:hypothetical protein